MIDRENPKPTPARRSGMTLIELTVSIALVTMIMTACGSMIFFASKAMSSDSINPGTNAVAARSAVDQICDDLKVATAVTEQTATAITMTVPDRDGDGNAETIRYAWSGTAGSSLTRAYNGGAAGVVATNVQALNFTYLSKTVGKPPPVTGPEQTIATHATSSNTNSSSLTSSAWMAETFTPTLASTATQWTVTRCQISLSRSGVSTGTITVGLQYTDSAGKPTGSVLQSSTALILNVGTTGQNWIGFTFSSPVALTVGKPVCLVVSYAAIVGSGGSIYYDNNSTDASMGWMNSSNSGSTWSTPTASKAMLFQAWGTVTTQDPQTMTPQPLPPSSQ